MKIDRDLPPYHAGRFFLPNTIVPDVVRRTVKLISRTTDDKVLAGEWAKGFMCDYVPLSDADFEYLSDAAPRMYADFPLSFIRAVLNLYMNLCSHTNIMKVIFVERPKAPEVEHLVQVEHEVDCASFAVMALGHDELVEVVRGQSMQGVCSLAREVGIPVYEIKNNPRDYRKRGLWLSAVHCVAVIGMTEVTEHLYQQQHVQRVHTPIRAHDEHQGLRVQEAPGLVFREHNIGAQKYLQQGGADRAHLFGDDDRDGSSRNPVLYSDSFEQEHGRALWHVSVGHQPGQGQAHRAHWDDCAACDGRLVRPERVRNGPCSRCEERSDSRDVVGEY